MAKRLSKKINQITADNNNLKQNKFHLIKLTNQVFIYSVLNKIASTVCSRAFYWINFRRNYLSNLFQTRIVSLLLLLSELLEFHFHLSHNFQINKQPQLVACRLFLELNVLQAVLIHPFKDRILRTLYSFKKFFEIIRMQFNYYLWRFSSCLPQYCKRIK